MWTYKPEAVRDNKLVSMCIWYANGKPNPNQIIRSNHWQDQETLSVDVPFNKAWLLKWVKIWEMDLFRNDNGWLCNGANEMIFVSKYVKISS